MRSIGHYLIDRLYEVGLRRIYGVPGDFNLNFLELLLEDGRIEWVGCCNELNAAYAADGDARISGFSAVLTTYGVGDLSALQPIAGSFCENVPVLSISGIPSLNAVKNRFPLHHTLLNGDYDNVMAAYRPFTAYQTRLTPEGKPEQEIDRLIEGILREKKPGYLQLPSDVTEVKTSLVKGKLDIAFPPSDPKTLETISNFIITKLNAAKRPFIAVDALVGRYGLEKEILSLCEKLKIPYCLTTNSKTLLPRKHPLFAGQYAGKGSIPASLYTEIAEADCVIGIGIGFSDLTNGLFSNDVSADTRIELTPYGASTGFAVSGRGLGKSITGARLEDVLKVIKEKANSHPAREISKEVSTFQKMEDHWCFEGFIQKVEAFLRSDDLLFVDTGTSSICANRLDFPDGLKYQAQNNWGAIGWATPAMLGASLAQRASKEERRLILLTGEGALQLTAQEISTMARHDLPVIIFVVNNKGYTVERAIEGKHSVYNDVAEWDYSKMLSVFAPGKDTYSASVKSFEELDQSLEIVKAGQKLSVIELHFDPLDAPESLWMTGKALAESDYSRTL